MGFLAIPIQTWGCHEPAVNIFGICIPLMFMQRCKIHISLWRTPLIENTNILKNFYPFLVFRYVYYRRLRPFLVITAYALVQQETAPRAVSLGP